jgi:hypothetical protein
MHSSKLPACRELAALLQASVTAKQSNSPAAFMISTAFFASIRECAGEMAYRLPHTHPCVRAEALSSLPALLSAYLAAWPSDHSHCFSLQPLTHVFSLSLCAIVRFCHPTQGEREGC